ncbi:MAG: hypothetical protein ACRCWQ_09945 [Bacilli bacterium]
MRLKEYAAYRGEEFLTIGTIDEVAAFLGLKKRSVQFMSTITHRRRTEQCGRQNAVCLYPFEEDEDDE